MGDVCDKFFTNKANPSFWIMVVHILCDCFAKFLLINILEFKSFTNDFCNLIFELKRHVGLPDGKPIKFVQVFFEAVHYF
jgi:hypothetical protein